MGSRKPAEADPLSAADFAACFADLSASTGSILAAVSGGPDSTALMYGLAAWAAEPGRPDVLVATVDHGLRPEARTEAEGVGQAAAALGLTHHILTWTPPPSRISQEQARQARYALLLRLAGETGVGTLVTAHTQDDQAETILMRAAAGSGLSGLAGMRRVVARGRVRHVRPLLGIPKARLVATCRLNGWAFVEDPSNANSAYARARWRRLTPLLAAEGLDAERLAALGTRLARADAALDALARAALERALTATENGTSSLALADLAREPEEIGLRVLSLALAGSTLSWPGLTQPSRSLSPDGSNSGVGTGGTSEPPSPSGRDGRVTPGHDEERESGDPVSAPPLRLERLEACYAALITGITERKRLRRTLAGRQLTLDRTGRLTIEAEPPRWRGRRK